MRVLTLFVVVFLLGADDAGDKAAKDELKLLAGTWQVVPLDGSENDKTAQIAAKKLKTKIDGDKYAVMSEGKVVEEGTLKVNPSKTPKTLDMTVKKADGKGRVVECIYKLDGDTILIATALPGKARPMNFDAGARDSGLTKSQREKQK